MSNFFNKLSDVIPLGDTKQKIIVGVFLVTIIVIPLFSMAISKRSTISSANSDPRSFDQGPVTQTPEEASKSSALAQLQAEAGQIASPAPSTSTETTTAVSFGPTLSFQLSIEGRPSDKQASSKFFVGIAAGGPTNKPTYLLSFTVDIPDSGIFNSISLAGLESGSQYTAYLKGSAQLATSSAFLMSPGVSSLNDGVALSLLSGDLNEDNIINAADLTIAQAAYGSTSKSTNWNQRADLNVDGVVNTIDLGFVLRNMGYTGQSGAWYSTTPSSSQSAIPTNIGGYWMWVPR